VSVGGVGRTRNEIPREVVEVQINEDHRPQAVQHHEPVPRLTVEPGDPQPEAGGQVVGSRKRAFADRDRPRHAPAPFVADPGRGGDRRPRGREGRRSARRPAGGDWAAAGAIADRSLRVEPRRLRANPGLPRRVSAAAARSIAMLQLSESIREPRPRQRSRDSMIADRALKREHGGRSVRLTSRRRQSPALGQANRARCRLREATTRERGRVTPPYSDIQQKRRHERPLWHSPGCSGTRRAARCPLVQTPCPPGHRPSVEGIRRPPGSI